MPAVLFRLRVALRARFATTAVLTVVVAITCGIVIALAAGAQRTASAPDRYIAEEDFKFDAAVWQDFSGEPRTDEVRGLPGIAEVYSATFTFSGFDGIDAIGFSGSHRAVGLRVVAGRENETTNEHEFMASQSFVDQSGVAIGDSLELVTLTQTQVDDTGFDTSDPRGPRFSMTLVGILDGPAALEDPTPIFVISPTILDNNPEIAVALTLMAVELRPGVDLEQLRTQLDSLPNSGELSLEAGGAISADIRRAVGVQASGLWILAAAAAIAALAALGQLITRHVRPSTVERERLSAIGLTRHQILGESFGQALVVVVVGVGVGAALATLPSGVFPIGFVRIVEPAPGMRTVWGVVLLAAVLFALALSLWTLAGLRVDRGEGRSQSQAFVAERLATRSPNVRAATGIRFALGPNSARRGSTAGGLIAAAITLTAVVAAVTFGFSLNRLVGEPFRYGVNHDFAIGDDGSSSLPEGLSEALSQIPDVKSLVVYSVTFVRAGDRSVPILAMNVVRGEGTPHLMSGRLPAGSDEIVLGGVTARQLDSAIGDRVDLVGPTGAGSFRVTGIAVLPGFGQNDGIGDGGLVSVPGLALLDSSAQPLKLAIQVDGSVEELFASNPQLDELGPRPELFKPSAILNLERIRAIPFVLAGLLALMALVTIAHLLVVSIHAQRRDSAVLCALGADRVWLRRAVHWQATIVAVTPALLAIPVGFVVGRLVFGAFADNIGAIDAASVPVARAAVGFVAAVVLVNAVAAIPARRAAMAKPSLVLRTE